MHVLIHKKFPGSLGTSYSPVVLAPIMVIDVWDSNLTSPVPHYLSSKKIFVSRFPCIGVGLLVETK